MEAESKHALYGTPLFNAAGVAIMDFTPINQIHQHLCAFHSYSNDPNQQVRSHHFCTHLKPDLHQCIIYDSDKADARLIGIEYLVSEAIFRSLPAEEKRYWHSHKFEVESGMLVLPTKPLVPALVTDAAEQPAMLEIRKLYGKTIHTWAFDEHPALPLGPPRLMMSVAEAKGVNQQLLDTRDADLGVSTAQKKELREGYIPKDGWEPSHEADQWKSGRSVVFTPKVVDVEPIKGKNSTAAE